LIRFHANNIHEVISICLKKPFQTLSIRDLIVFD